MEDSQQERDKVIYSLDKIHPKDKIDGSVTREIIGNLIANGHFQEAKFHIINGIKHFGKLRIEDAIQNELMNEYLKARKIMTAEKERIINNIKSFEKIFREILHAEAA